MNAISDHKRAHWTEMGVEGMANVRVPDVADELDGGLTESS